MIVNVLFPLSNVWLELGFLFLQSSFQLNMAMDLQDLMSVGRVINVK